ncbi:MAG: hypothetical protein QM699_00015 [Amaricoccus sp.]|uniref:hypothetical protein n=1 Tax=Amaricoccus sp. TaxID=1872485 RepID=UPI0039E313C6
MYIWVDELTTVAAAYALDNFITINGNTVNISAPANNNASVGSCSGTGAAMTCVSAGLTHAFLNAANLVDAVGSFTAPPTGQVHLDAAASPGSDASIAALGTSTANGGVNPYTLANTVPVAVINTLGNILQACVNSTGGVASDGSPCGVLFQNATPSSLYSAATAAPTNTLQAAMNIARTPFVNVANLYNLATASGFYQPALVAAPNDWSISIQYHSATFGATVTPLGYPFSVALDANDSVYVSGNSTGSSPVGTGATPVLISKLSSNGVGVWQTSLASSTVCATGVLGNLCNEALDAVGNLYLADVGYLYQVSTATGTPTAFTKTLSTASLNPINVAVDRYNGLFVTTNNVSSKANLVTYPAGSTATTAPTIVTAIGLTQPISPIPTGLGFDSNGDLGITLYGSSPMKSYFLANSSSTSTSFGTASLGVLAASGDTDTQMEWVVFDANNNFYANSLVALYELPAGSYGSTANVAGSYSGGSIRGAAIDGNGSIFMDDGNFAMRVYYPKLGTPTTGAFTGCLPWGDQATTVTSTSTATTSTESSYCSAAIWNGASKQQYPMRGTRNLAIDSTGAI